MHDERSDPDSTACLADEPAGEPCADSGAGKLCRDPAPDDGCAAPAKLCGPPGRPKDQARRQAMLEAARSLLTQRGLSGVTIEGVAEAASVSKMTVYNHFGDKIGLFEAMVSQECRRHQQAIDALLTVEGDLREALTQAICGHIVFAESPEIVAVDCALAAEGARHPGLVDAFFEAGPRALLQAFGRLVAEIARREGLTVPNTLALAEDLICVCEGVEHWEVHYGLRPARSFEQVYPRVRRLVALLLDAHRSCSCAQAPATP